MNKFTKLIAFLCIATAFTACKKDSDPIVVVPPSDGSTLTLNGLIGTETGASAGNSVFVDFSTDKQTSVARETWDLGFYCGTDFRVILNPSVGATAIAIDKTDLNLVTAADSLALGTSLSLGQGAGAMSAVDAVDGNTSAYLNGTVIAAVSATDAENKVYLVNRGTAGLLSGARGWQKIRVIRNGAGYTLQYAKINETTFKTLTITKDAAYNFKAVSFVTGAATVEPLKADWDLQWGLSTYKASATIPYTFSDLVLINFVGGVTAGEVLTSTVSYAAFAESNIAGVTFLGTREAIGSKWRVTSAREAGAVLGVLTDRFYVLKDAAGNVYKLKFVSFIAEDGGTRGKPVIEYKLVKKG
ncbi:HmuY family protein [Pedobacter sp. AW31-3R]|uniref:HmuY family protein n=1 Tax=Pedobacter sp. AW31-3R TaxID=3445781 RepID=UPI003FA1597F